MAELSGSQRQELDEIRRRFALKLPEQLRAIEQTARRLRSRARPELLERLLHQAHRLAGSAAIFGYKDLASAAAALEQLLSAPPEARAASWSDEVAGAVRRVRDSRPN